MDGETLAERAWRTLGEVADERMAVGKAAYGLNLPFPVLDDGSTVQAPLAGLVAGLQTASHDLAVVLPVDCPLVTTELLLELACACARADAAVPQTGPLPGAYRRTALPELERCLAAGRLSLRHALSALRTQVVPSDAGLLVNVNTPADLDGLVRRAGSQLDFVRRLRAPGPPA